MRGDWIGRVLIGGVLTALSVLFIPVFLVFGYLVRVLETTIDGAETPPAFEEWGDIFMKGIFAVAIAFVYTFVPITLYSIFAVVVLATGGALGGDLGAVVGLLGVLMLLALVPVLFLVYYAVPAAIAAYAADGELTAAFDVGVLKPILLSTDYLAAVILPIVVALVVWTVTGILTVTIIGVVLIPFVQFYGQVAVFRMFGTAFANVSGRVEPAEPGSEPKADPPESDTDSDVVA
ncbi:MAG: DUF4013 domain-containing protein [Halorubrum sp.]